MKVQRNRQSAVGSRQSAFTLVELLVVIGIIAVLLGLLLPAVMSAMRGGDKARISYQIQTLSLGINAYKTDFGVVPTANMRYGIQSNSDGGNGRTGGVMMTRWVIAPGAALVDGLDGDGQRLASRTGEANGKILPAYVQSSNFRILTVATRGPNVAAGPYNNDEYWKTVGDAVGNQFFYYSRRSLTATPQTNVASAGNTGMWNTDDNTDMDNSKVSRELFQYIVGDRNCNGVIDADENYLVTTDFIIISPGGSRSYPSMATASSRRDDYKKATVVTNVPD